MRKITRLLGMIHRLPDKAYLKIAYRLECGAKLRLDDPKTINEKLQWLKLNGATWRFAKYVDKWAVRAYVEKVLGPEFLVPALGVYENPEEVPWDELPDQFVAKCTHGSHCGIVCTDKRTLDIRDAKRRLHKWLRRDWYHFGREPVYKGLHPRILVEQFVGTGKQTPDDYKIMCFNGRPLVVQVHHKEADAHSIDFYNLRLEHLNIRKTGFPNRIAEPLSKALVAPLIDAAEKLAQSVDCPYVRTDFYAVDGKVYFSEMTFFDSSGFRGFEPEPVNRWLGDMLVLDKMVCPTCGGKMKWIAIAGSKDCDYIERYDKCADCEKERMVKTESSS